MYCRPIILLAVTGLCALVATGCGGHSTGTVSGNVTYDGQPLKKGIVTFSPADGRGPSAGGAVSEGQYRVENVAVGKMIVHITHSGEATPCPGYLVVWC
jgi:hypothetical protein